MVSHLSLPKWTTQLSRNVENEECRQGIEIAFRWIKPKMLIETNISRSNVFLQDVSSVIVFFPIFGHFLIWMLLISSSLLRNSILTTRLLDNNGYSYKQENNRTYSRETEGSHVLSKLASEQACTYIYIYTIEGVYNFSFPFVIHIVKNLLTKYYWNESMNMNTYCYSS